MALQDLTPQLRTRLGRVERTVGLFVGLAVVLLLSGFAYFVWHTAESKGWFKRKARYFTFIADGTGIHVGAEVRMTGFKIGEVTKVETMPMEDWVLSSRSFVFVRFDVVEPYFGYIWSDSKVRLGSGDLLGSRGVEVTRGLAGIVTVTNLPTGRLGHLHKDYAKTKVATYVDLNEGTEGFFLASSEQQPLPDKLNSIASDIHAALPGILNLTNSVHLAMSNLTSLTAQLDAVAPLVRSTMAKTEGLIDDIRPLTRKPGGVGDLLLPTNLTTQLTLVLSNLNARSEALAPTMSNLTQVVGNVSTLVSNLNLQIGRETNLVGNVSRLADHAGELAVTTDTLLRRHWLFRSAYKTNRSELEKQGEVQPPRLPPSKPRLPRDR